MDEEPKTSIKEETTRMFVGRSEVTTDEELAVHIFHRFNICRDTMESMPAFEPHLKPMFKDLDKKE